MRSEPRQAGDIFAEAIAERVVDRIGEHIDRIVQRPMIQPEVYSLAEAAEALRVSVATLQRYVTFGQVRSVTIGSRRLIPLDEVRRVASHGVVLDETAS